MEDIDEAAVIRGLVWYCRICNGRCGNVERERLEVVVEVLRTWFANQDNFMDFKETIF